MQRIVPNIWFDHTAEEAAQFYTSVFPDGRIVQVQHYPSEGLPDFQAGMAGQPVTVEFDIGGYRMMGINAGAEFAPNPSVSSTSTPRTPTPTHAWTSCGPGCPRAGRR